MKGNLQELTHLCAAGCEESFIKISLSGVIPTICHHLSATLSTTSDRARVAIFWHKIIPRNIEQVGTDGSSVGILLVSRRRKTSEFRSEPFLGREKQNSIPSHFSEEKNPRNSVPNHFSEEKNPRNSVPNYSRKRKTLGISFQTIFRREKPRNFDPSHFRKMSHEYVAHIWLTTSEEYVPSI